MATLPLLRIALLAVGLLGVGVSLPGAQGGYDEGEFYRPSRTVRPAQTVTVVEATPPPAISQAWVTRVPPHSRVEAMDLHVGDRVVNPTPHDPDSWINQPRNGREVEVLARLVVLREGRSVPGSLPVNAATLAAIREGRLDNAARLIAEQHPELVMGARTPTASSAGGAGNVAANETEHERPGPPRGTTRDPLLGPSLQGSRRPSEAGLGHPEHRDDELDGGAGIRVTDDQLTHREQRLTELWVIAGGTGLALIVGLLILAGHRRRRIVREGPPPP